MTKDDIDASEAPLMEHLLELRTRAQLELLSTFTSLLKAKAPLPRLLNLITSFMLFAKFEMSADKNFRVSRHNYALIPHRSVFLSIPG